MILYEYRCLKCEAIFQKFTTSKSRLIISCPSCSSKKVKKLIVTVSNINKDSSKSCQCSCNQCNGCK